MNYYEELRLSFHHVASQVKNLGEAAPGAGAPQQSCSFSETAVENL